MNCTIDNTSLNCCVLDNLSVVTPILVFIFLSIIFNIISCSFWSKFHQERKRRRKRLKAVRKLRNKKKKRYSEKNLEYEKYIKRDNSTISEWAFNQYMDDLVV